MMTRRIGRSAISLCTLSVVLLTAVPPALAAGRNAKELPYPVADLGSVRMAWRQSAIREALNVFPHPVIPERVLLATGRGLLLSEDSGTNWKPLEQATTARMGQVHAIAFAPAHPDTFFAGTDRGVWFSTDAGKSWKQIGTRQQGLAADRVVGLVFYFGDVAFRTLVAVHGDAASGASVSYDSGQTWSTIWPALRVRQVLCSPHLGEARNGMAVLVIAQALKDPDVTNIYAADNLGETLVEQMHDIIPTEAAVGLFPAGGEVGRALLGTADAGLYRVEVSYIVSPQRVGPPQATAWPSVGMTCGPAPGTQLAYAYEPQKLGLVLSLDDFTTTASFARGLPTGPLIREGAGCGPMPAARCFAR